MASKEAAANGGKKLPLKEAYKFGEQHSLSLEIDEIRDMEFVWKIKYDSTVRRGYIIDLFERRGLWEAFKKAVWPEGDSPGGRPYVGGGRSAPF